MIDELDDQQHAIAEYRRLIERAIAELESKMPEHALTTLQAALRIEVCK